MNDQWVPLILLEQMRKNTVKITACLCMESHNDYNGDEVHSLSLYDVSVYVSVYSNLVSVGCISF